MILNNGLAVMKSVDKYEKCDYVVSYLWKLKDSHIAYSNGDAKNTRME